MSTFKSLAMARHPRDAMWTATRDALPSVVRYLDDIDRLIVEERADEQDGTVRIVNQWRAKVAIPAVLSGVIKPEMLCWTDRAVWDPREHACRFRIETHFFPERVRCSGCTRYEVAMGGRGTRVSFEGEIRVDARGIPGVPALLEPTISKGIEMFVSTLIPNNLRKVVDVVSRHLDASAKPEG